MTVDAFLKNTENFHSWLTNSVGYKLSPKIKIADGRDTNQGRFILATEDIKTDELLFEIPRESILNVLTSSLVSEYPAWENILLDGDVGHWEGLIICMLFEIKVKKNMSKWAPYFDVLPESTDLNSLMYWTAEELEALKPSLVLDRIGNDGAHQMHEKVMELIRTFEKDHSVDLSFGTITWEDFLYVASIIMSYSFDVELPPTSADENEEDDEVEEDVEQTVRNEGSLKSMIPLADTLNSDTNKCNAHLIYDEDSLKMRAISNIKAGEQVYNIYGNHPNAEILRRYGYVEWEGSKYDFGELPLEVIIETLHEQYDIPIEKIRKILKIFQTDEAILELVDDEDIIVDAYDCYVDGELGPEVVVLLQIFCILLQTPNLKKILKSSMVKLLQRVTKKCLQLIERGLITEQCLILWEKCIRKRLLSYNHVTPVSASMQFTGDTHELRLKMASKVLDTEMKSLNNCLLSLEKQYKTLPDEKLLTNILKRNAEADDEPKNRKKPRR
ncbi:hypothetical protein NCAS_0A08050 [Naumovozyma castellii]|uniref:Ribosomal lysine N-methyltransferase 4 n=1 Tax=Naumovozyma castellii TaxID=27288 RepID=G0V7B5_NAUCA|nr:hypothetical protein NCAS_0A08050 [Naumovozyma castellii CBS 4309]CCC67363.1 hypothetical protein NCAS_0A08050 [Naumovozyma castellii CBS 4309]